MNKPFILLGGGGHAAVLAEILSILKHSILGFTDVQAPDADANTRLSALNYLGDDATVLSAHSSGEINLINGLGSTGAIDSRASLFNYFIAEGYGFTDVEHPTAYLSPSVSHGQGLQLLAGAIVNTNAQIGANVLINSQALVEHHCVIGDHSHIASGAVVCGDCHIGQSVHVGAGAVINQGITIGDGAIIASGAVVIADIPAGSMVAGVPAQQK
jgi:UDP-perosamine 4-acetyltransferase